MNIRVSSHRLQGLALFVTFAAAAGGFQGCAPASPAPASAPAAKPAAALVSATPAPLDLCRPPGLAPEDVRSKPGYTQFRVSVTGAGETPISGLKASDFTVRSGSQSYPLAYFAAESNATPVSLVVVTDVSDTMYGKLTDSRQANLRRARSAIVRAEDQLNECDELALVTVGGTDLDTRHAPLPPAGLAQPFTTNQVAVLSRVYSIRPSGQKLLLDGIRKALAIFADAHYENRALVILTDGVDANAMQQSEKLLSQAPKGEFSLWVIGIGDPDLGAGVIAKLRGTRIDTEAIKHLASAGGGAAIFAKPIAADDGASLAAAITTINDNLARGYTIGTILPVPSPKAEITLAHNSDSIVSQTLIPPKLLADAASRPATITAQECAAAASISSRPGFTTMTVSVAEDNQTPVEGLKESDFRATCAEKSCPIVYFAQSGGGAPKSIAIVIDTSGSMQPKLETVRREVNRLVEHLGPCDELTLFAFSSRAYLLHPPTTDHKSIENRLPLLHAYGQTALYDSLVQALSTEQGTRLHDRAIVLITDGADNISATSRADLLADLRSARVPVYAIGIGDTDQRSTIQMGPFTIGGGGTDVADPDALRDIASASGGQALIVPQISDDGGTGFASAITKVDHQLNAGYQVGVIAPPASPPPVITLADKPGLTVTVNAQTTQGK